MTDASFEDGGEQPLRLRAEDSEGLQVLSALCQDAVFPIAEMTWRPKKRDFSILLNRFRWEDKRHAEARGRPFERVQSVLIISDVLNVASQGIDRTDKSTVLSLLSVTWEPGEDGAGHVVITLAGDAECLDVSISDVTRPYIAPSGKAPKHAD